MSRDIAGRVAPWVQMHWDGRAAGNFIGGGTGSGLVLAVVLAGAMPQTGALLLGLACVAGGLLCVWAEIGRPWRALNVFRHAATSWMTREALVAPVLIGCGLLAAGTGAAGWRVASAACAALYLYCQARMLQAAKGIPAWRQPRSVPLLFVTGIAEGSGLLALWCVLTAAAPGRVAALLAVACAVRIAAWTAYHRGVRRDGAPRAALDVLDELHQPLRLADAAAALLAAAGMVFGLAWLAGFAGATALASGWLLKWTIVRRAAYNQGFALVMAPERGVGGQGPPARPGWD